MAAAPVYGQIWGFWMLLAGALFDAPLAWEPYLCPLKSGFDMTLRSEVFPLPRLPLPAGVTDFRGSGLASPRPFSASVGRWVLRRSQSPWLGFNSAPSLPSRPRGSHLTGCTGHPEKSPCGWLYACRPKASRFQALHGWLSGGESD